MTDLEHELRERLHGHADSQVIPAMADVESITAVSRSRTRLRRGLATAAAVVLLVGGLVAVLAVAGRGDLDSSTPADVPERCSAEACSYVAAFDADATGGQRVLVVVGDPGPGGTRLITRETDGGWRRIESDLPAEFAPLVAEHANGRIWVGGSLPSPERRDVDVPAIAWSVDGRAWRVERLEIASTIPDGMLASTRVDSLAIAGNAALAAGTPIELVSGDAAGTQPTLLDEPRPQWLAGSAGEFSPDLREAATEDWDVFASDGQHLLAVLVGRELTFTSIRTPETDWQSTAPLDCPDGSPGVPRWPSTHAAPGWLAVAGSCDGVATVWFSDDDAATWSVSQPQGARGEITTLVVGPDGTRWASADDRIYRSDDPLAWTVIDEDGRVIAATDTDLIVATERGVEIVPVGGERS